MTELTEKKAQEIISQQNVDDLTRLMLDLPQADCPVAHYFGDKIYIRQVMFPAGIFAIGHKQRFAQMNIFISGKVAMVQRDGSLKEMAAPMIFEGPPGQKMGFILEPVTWLNVYPNPDDERDIDVLEAKWLDKKGPFTHFMESKKPDVIEDRRDYGRVLRSFGCTESQVLMESISDIQLDAVYKTVLSFRKSNIHGHGVFTSWPYEKDTPIAPLIIDGKRNELVRYLNHSADPNADLRRIDDENIILIANRNIPGCEGGSQGHEITIDYRQYIKMRLKK